MLRDYPYKPAFDSIVSTQGVEGCLHNLVVHVGNTKNDVQTNNIHANKMVALTEFYQHDCKHSSIAKLYQKNKTNKPNRPDDILHIPSQ